MILCSVLGATLAKSLEELRTLAIADVPVDAEIDEARGPKAALPV